MVGSKATRFVTTREVIVVASAVRNQAPLLLLQDSIGPKMGILWHTYLVRASQLATYVQESLI